MTKQERVREKIKYVKGCCNDEMWEAVSNSVETEEWFQLGLQLGMMQIINVLDNDEKLVQFIRGEVIFPIRAILAEEECDCRKDKQGNCLPEGDNGEHLETLNKKEESNEGK